MSSDSGRTVAVRTIGRYRAYDELGRGAMGIVYRGFDPVIGRTVALKTLLLDSADAQVKEFRDRLYREAAAAGALSHPNIVTIFDIVEDGGITAVAMEFIEGESLASIIAGRGPLPIDVAVDFLDQLCSALDFASGHGIIHRDIKPANILVTPSGRAKVTDFGVARLAMSTATQAGTVLGSPSYMSPEQVRGLTLDGRSDLFSAAVVFYEMVTRERPFAGNDIATTMYRIAHEPPTPPGQFNPAISPEVTRVLERALAKDPGDRFGTGLELVAALRHAVAPQIRAVTTPALDSGEFPAVAVSPSPAAASPAAASQPAASPAAASPVTTRIAPAAPAPESGPVVPVGVADVPVPGPDVHASPVTASGPLPAVEAGPRQTVARPETPPAAAKQPAQPARSRRPMFIGLAVAAVALVAVVALAFLRGTGGIPQTTAPDGTSTAPTAPVSPASPQPPASQAPSQVAGTPAATVPGPGVPPPGRRPKPTRPAPSGTSVPAPAATGPSAVAPPVAPPVAPAAGRDRAPLGRVYNAADVNVRVEVLRQVAPLYPASAERAGTEDVVIVKVLVGPDGQAADVQILRGSKKDPAFDGAAIAAVRQWVFAPAQKGGQPVASWYNVGVPFQLKR